MCGIAGLFGQGGQALGEAARAMADALTHRGPDDAGMWEDAAAGVALAHRRLSIIDLSAHGHQPMVSASERYVLCYNGELYNFRELKAQLDYPFRGDSDSEVWLAAIEAWGLEQALERARGMFAFALWDAKEQSLTLVRDRMGEKPLYYGMHDGALVFASELKAFAVLPGFAPNIDRQALASLMGYRYIAPPQTIYEGIHKLQPGELAVVKGGQLKTRRYFSYTEMLAEAEPWSGSEAEAIDALEETLRTAIRRQMIADVPLGAFLSGGIDSSTIVALMQAEASAPVHSFSIGFTESGYDEAPHAKAVADHLGTNHTELYVTPEQAREAIPQLPSMYDEPFADSSQIPTYLVAKLARAQVTVALSGDGGDELFGGYNRYRQGVALWQKLGGLPKPIFTYLMQPLLALAGKHRMHAYAGKLVASSDAAQFYQQLCMATPAPESLVIGAEMLPQPPQAGDDFAAYMMQQDALGYLPGDILTKVDRAAMAVSLETRIPLLDLDVVQLAARLPMEMKLRGGKGKWALWQVLYQHVPRELIERPKAGFALPLAAWLRGPLAEWAGDLLSPERLKREGYLNAEPIAKLWYEHRTCRRDHADLLWNVLMFESWLDTAVASSAYT